MRDCTAHHDMQAEIVCLPCTGSEKRKWSTAIWMYHSALWISSTSIACSYLKAIQQLLHKLLKSNLKYPSEDSLWIKRENELPKALYIPSISCRTNPSSGKPQVAFAKEYEACFDITMAPMSWFIHDNPNGWEISGNVRITTHSFLRNYGDECKNDHFHKDNIDDIDVDTCIRNNSLLLTAYRTWLSAGG